MINILHLLIITNAVEGVIYDLVLKDPVQINGPIVQQFSINIKPDSTSDVILSQIQISMSNYKIEVIDRKLLNSISVEISHVIGLNSHINHLHWETSITQHLGSTKLIGINADINNHDVKFTIVKIELTQPIPVLHKLETQCAHTGRRRFGFFGPRKRVCNNINVIRGLTGDEITTVTNTLAKRAAELKYMIQ